MNNLTRSNIQILYTQHYNKFNNLYTTVIPTSVPPFQGWLFLSSSILTDPLIDLSPVSTLAVMSMTSGFSACSRDREQVTEKFWLESPSFYEYSTETANETRNLRLTLPIAGRGGEWDLLPIGCRVYKVYVQVHFWHVTNLSPLSEQVCHVSKIHLYIYLINSTIDG